jgi:predicted dehydrogenase
MARLRLGVIGAGSWTVASHLPELSTRRDDVEFVAVSRKGPELLEKIKTDWGFEVASEDYRDVLDAGVDICLVASPTRFHHEHAKAALESGAHVLVEKPMTITPEDAWDLSDTADRLERHLLLSFGWNYKPIMREAKRLMVEQGVGNIEQLMVHMGSTTRELLLGTGAYPAASPDTVPESRTWNDPELSGGGFAQAQLTHALGMALWLTDLHATEVFAMMSAPFDAPVELHDAVAMRFSNGAIGTMDGGSSHVNANNNKHQLEVRFIGADGQLQLDLEREELWLFRAPDVNVRPTLEPDAGLYDCAGPPHALVDLALGKDVENCSPGWLGARTVDVLDACYRSARDNALATIEVKG